MMAWMPRNTMIIAPGLTVDHHWLQNSRARQRAYNLFYGSSETACHRAVAYGVAACSSSKHKLVWISIVSTLWIQYAVADWG